MPHTFHKARNRRHRQIARHLFVIEQRDIENRVQVRRGPPPINIGFGKANIRAVAYRAAPCLVVVAMNDTNRSVFFAFCDKGSAIGQRDLDPPARETIHRAENGMKPARQLSGGLQIGDGRCRCVHGVSRTSCGRDISFMRCVNLSRQARLCKGRHYRDADKILHP